MSGRAHDRGEHRADTVSAEVECPTDSSLEIRATYHPNWRVLVDGAPVVTYMVSPSYIGIDLPAGRHRVDAVYVATPSKSPLLAIGPLLSGTAALFRRRLDEPAAWVARTTRGELPDDPGADDEMGARGGPTPAAAT